MTSFKIYKKVTTKKGTTALRLALEFAFPTYDAARNYARKLARKTMGYYWFGANYRNPSINAFGYTIKKV